MRILILGNMANDGYSVAKAMRSMNQNVDLAVDVSDFGMGLPEWEDADIIEEIDPYSASKESIRKSWNAPKWIRYFDLLNSVPYGKSRWAKSIAKLKMMKMIREYDIVEAHVPFAIYSQFSGIPYIVYDAGWIREFPYGQDYISKLAQRGYAKAKAIIITNPDTFEISDKLSYLNQRRIFFSPFAIDPEKYRPIDATSLREKYARSGELILFSPARQKWDDKGNDKMLRAYAKFVNDFPNSKFILVSWSVDEQRSRSLIEELGLSNNIHWIKPVPKNQLIQYYNAADIVLDQFNLGSWGTSTPEAMACGKPVVMYYKKNHILRAFGEEPPILNAFTEAEIYHCLLMLAKNEDYRIEIGKQSHKWVSMTHSPKLVASMHLKAMASTL